MSTTLPASLLEKAARLKKSAPAPAGFAKFLDSLGPEQRACVDDDSPKVVNDSPRRSGKSTAFLGKMLRAFQRRPGLARVCFVGPTTEQAIKILWDDVERFSHQYGLGLVPRYADECFERLGCRLDFAGFATRREADKLRGQKYDLIGVDEAQLGPEWFGYFIEESLLPTLLDYGGRLYMSGTPGLTADGFFFDACHSAWWKHHRWTPYQNPFFAGRDIASELEVLGITPGTPKYRREWLGEWVIDPDVLVFRIPDEAIKSPSNDTYYANVGGLDLGYNDSDAISVVGVKQNRTSTHLRHVEEKAGQTNAQLLDACKRVAMKFGVRTFVCDSGGLGKKIVNTFRVECPQIQWIAAEKDRKLEHIELLNSDMVAGKHTVETGSAVIRDSKRVRWGQHGKIDDRRFHSDANDAWLYSFRYARQMLRELPATKQVDDAVADEYFEKLRQEDAKSQKSPFRRTA